MITDSKFSLRTQRGKTVSLTNLHTDVPKARAFTSRKLSEDIKIPKLPLVDLRDKNSRSVDKRSLSSRPKFNMYETKPDPKPKVIKFKRFLGSFSKDSHPVRPITPIKDISQISSEQERIQFIIENVRRRLNEKDETKRMNLLEISKKIYARNLEKHVPVIVSSPLPIARHTSPEKVESTLVLHQESDPYKRYSPDPLPSQFSVKKKSRFRLALTEGNE